MDSIDHGAVVIMTLTVGECHSLDIAQLGPEWVILRAPARITAAPGVLAEIDLRVGGERRTWPAALPAGIALGQDRIPIAAPCPLPYPRPLCPAASLGARGFTGEKTHLAMKKHHYCYYITNGVSRSAIQCGTVAAPSMEAAAEIAAKRAGLTKVTPDSDTYPFRPHWTKDGKRRSVYVLHDPA